MSNGGVCKIAPATGSKKLKKKIYLISLHTTPVHEYGPVPAPVHLILDTEHHKHFTPHV